MTYDQDKTVSHPPSPELDHYLRHTFGAEDPELAKIRDQARKHNLPPIHVGALDGRLLTFFAHSVHAKKIVEIGTLAGYSAVCLARGLQPQGKLWTFEKSAEHAALAQKHFAALDLQNTIEIREGSALHNLSGFHESVDLVFIDADKESYGQYFEWAAQHVRAGGLILADNTLAWGQVYHPTNKDPRVMALRDYNARVARDPRVFSTLIPTGEGLTVSVKL
jgi:caffeoyl-CoA O-methyltransferase